MAINWHSSSLIDTFVYPRVQPPTSGTTSVRLVKARLRSLDKTVRGRAQTVEPLHSFQRRSLDCCNLRSNASFPSKKEPADWNETTKKKQELLSEAHNVEIKCLKGKTLNEGEVCSICFDDLKINSAVQLMQCGHRLCLDCQTICAQRKMSACPYCRKKNTLKQRKLLINDKFDSSTVCSHATNKCSLLKRLVKSAVTVVVFHCPATAKFLTQFLIREGVQVVNYATLKTSAAFQKLQRMKQGVILLSSRLMQHSLQLKPVKSIIFFEPSLDHGSWENPSNVYRTNWSCDKTAWKTVLYTGKTLEETAIKYGRQAVKTKQNRKLSCSR